MSELQAPTAAVMAVKGLGDAYIMEGPHIRHARLFPSSEATLSVGYDEESPAAPSAPAVMIVWHSGFAAMSVSLLLSDAERMRDALSEFLDTHQRMWPNE